MRIAAIAILCASIIFVLSSLSEDILQSKESNATFENTSDQTQNINSNTKLQKELISTKELITAPIGGFHTNFIRLKPGELDVTNYTFYSRNSEPGEVSYNIYRVKKVYETEDMGMPDGLSASIEPSGYIAQPNENYTSKLIINTTPELTFHGAGTEYTLYLQADFEGENRVRSDDWIRILVEGEETVPGASGLYQPYLTLQNESITLETGQIGETYCTYYTGGVGIRDISYEVHRISDESDELPVPSGLTVNIEPSNFIAKNFENYTSHITVKTSPDLPSGEYILNVEILSNGRTTEEVSLTVNVSEM